MEITSKILDNFTTLEVLGSGMFGTVSKIESNGKHYALKIEKIRESALQIENIMSTEFSEWREIIFSTQFANLHQDQFITLIEHDIIDHCEYPYTEKYRNHMQYLPLHVVKKLQEKELSTHCIRKVYNLIGFPLKKIIKKTLSQKEYYSIFSQIIYICWLLQSNGYTHNDFHSDNVGVVKRDADYIIEIDSHPLYTNGYQIILFDYGNVLHTSYKMTPEEELQYKYNIKNEILRPILKFITFEENDQMTKLIKWDDNLEFFELWIASSEYEQFERPITITNFEIKYQDGREEIKDITCDLSNTNKFTRYLAYQILFYDQFQKSYFRDKYISTHKPIHSILPNDYLHILNNISNLHELVYYMVNKTNQLYTEVI